MPGLTAAQFQAVLGTTVDGVILIDDRGVVRTFNLAAERMFGYGAAEVVGRNVSMLMTEPDRSRHDSYLRTYLRTGVAHIIGIGREAVGRRKDGSLLPIDLAVSEVRFGRRRNFVGIVRDITARKALEREVLEVSEREQRMVGRELHDGLCQELAGIAFLAQSVQLKLGTGAKAGASAGAAEEAAQVTSLLHDAVRHARDLSFGMFPVDPQPNGLEVALGRLAETTSAIFKVQCTFHAPQPVELCDTSAATHLYRIAQDAVRDAWRQGKAAHVMIDLERRRGAVELRIVDDGTGPSQNGRFRHDMTLPLMEHRARVMGAALRVRRRRGGGASVVCTLPGRPPADGPGEPTGRRSVNLERN